jgi:N-acetylgalactosamine kinase
MDFLPLSVAPVAVPGDLAFVVAHSMVTAEKTGAAMDRYNRRSMECRLATAVLAATFRKRTGANSPIRVIGDLKPDVLPLPKEKIREIADSAIERSSYSLKQIAAILDLPEEEAAGRFCRRKDGSILPEPEDGFKLGLRYRHVVSEWERVVKAMDALRRRDGKRLGRLMDESHASCRDLYEISCPELERLTEAARRSGALGSRLTGAGFGGCTISLVPRASAADFLEKLSRDYYLPMGLEGGSALRDVLFTCRAVDGAGALPWRL